LYWLVINKVPVDVLTISSMRPNTGIPSSNKQHSI